MPFGSQKPGEQHPFTFVPRTNVREPISGRETEYRPWEAPPILAMADDPEVLLHQGEVYQMYSQLLGHSVPASYPLATWAAMRRQIMPSGDKATMDLQSEHEQTLMVDPLRELDGDDLAIHRKVNLGTANMAEIKRDFTTTGRKSGELAILRTVAGYRSEYYPAMMAEVCELPGLQFSEGSQRKFRTISLGRSTIRGANMDFITWGFKRHHGKFEDGTEVSSRHSVVVRTDPESEFPDDVREAMEKAALLDPSNVVNLSRVNKILREVAETGPAHPLAASFVTKLYLFNRGHAKQIKAREAARTPEEAGAA